MKMTLSKRRYTMISKEKIKAVNELVKNFKLKQSSILELYFIKLSELANIETKTVQDFIKQNKAFGLNYALVSDEVNVMADDEIAVYPLDPYNLDTLTDTQVFGVDDDISKNIKELIAKLNKLDISNLNINTIYIASGEWIQ